MHPMHHSMRVKAKKVSRALQNQNLDNVHVSSMQVPCDGPLHGTHVILIWNSCDSHVELRPYSIKIIFVYDHTFNVQQNFVPHYQNAVQLHNLTRFGMNTRNAGLADGSHNVQ